MSQRKALLILDAQVNMFDDEFHVHERERILKTIQSLISKARAAEIAIIYIRNDGGKGEPDEAGTAGWAIHPQLAPSTMI